MEGWRGGWCIGLEWNVEGKEKEIWWKSRNGLLFVIYNSLFFLSVVIRIWMNITWGGRVAVFWVFSYLRILSDRTEAFSCELEKFISLFYIFLRIHQHVLHRHHVHPFGYCFPLERETEIFCFKNERLVLDYELMAVLLNE